MLCITQIGGKQRTKTGNEKMNGAKYYAKYLSDEHEAGEPVGKFFGAGLADFGLEGKMPDFKTLNHLFNGEDLEGNKLVKGNQYRKNAYDLTFNCCKDVSVLFALADEDERHLIQQAQQHAVEAALAYIQDNATYTRVGAGGEETIQVKRLVAAVFEHSTARQAEGEDRPSVNLHSHAVVPNMIKLGKKYLTLHPDFYRHQMSASAIHSAELASSLKELGYSIESDKKNGFKISGVPDALKKAWSGRRDELLDAEKKLKLNHPLNKHKRRELAALGSRRNKGEVNRDDLFEIWQAEADEMGVSLEEIRHAKAQELPEPWSVDKTLAQLTEQQSTFNDIGLHKCVALASIVDGDAATIKARVNLVKQSKELVNLGMDDQGEKRYTTKEVLEIEKSIQGYAKGKQGENAHTVDQIAIQQAIKSRSLSAEQEAMLHHCCGADGVVVIQGSAGSGKSYSLGAVREASQASGYHIIGCALSAVAAQNLEEGSGIPSGTIHRLIYDIEQGRKSLDEKSVLIIDEAGTADSRLIHRLIKHANGAKLIFVGDTYQLEAIGLSFFYNLQDNIGYCELSENRRQKHSDDRKAVADFRKGNISEALSSYAKRGLLTISDDCISSQDALIDDWNNDRQQHDDLGIILASTNYECKELNKLARDKLKEAGALGDNNIFPSEYGSIELAENDRIIFTKNDIRLGVKNGSQGRVISVKENQYTVRLDNGDVISINPAEYGFLRHSYAITTHKAQGQSLSRAYIYSSGKMVSKELGYVQLTRAKDKTRIYADRGNLGELALEALTRQMSKCQQKETALDFMMKNS